MLDGIMRWAVGCVPRLARSKNAQDEASGQNVKDFHACIVQRVPCGKEIQVSCAVNNHVQLLSFQRDSCHRDVWVMMLRDWSSNGYQNRQRKAYSPEACPLFAIFTSTSTATRWDMSPMNRKMFILGGRGALDVGAGIFVVSSFWFLSTSVRQCSFEWTSSVVLFYSATLAKKENPTYLHNNNIFHLGNNFHIHFHFGS